MSEFQRPFIFTVSVRRTVPGESRSSAKSWGQDTGLVDRTVMTGSPHCGLQAHLESAKTWMSGWSSLNKKTYDGL